jgi:hypothetical protein
MIVLSKKYSLTLFLALNTAILFSQVALTVQGTIVNNSDTIWAGVNIERSIPTNLVYKNNSITSVNTSGYMLQAGDEGPDDKNNKLGGEVITGNKFTWKSTDLKSITHGLFTGYNLNAIIKYNYLDKVPLAIIRKSNGMTDVSGVIAYNIVRNPYVGVALKGINGIKIYNNTFYSERSPDETWRGIIDIYANDGFSPAIPSTRTIIKNNIFYTKYQIANIYIYENEDLTGFQSDYNVFYCESGTPMFNYLGVSKTFAQWQALGYDTHSVVVNPNFIDFTGLVPSKGLFHGTNLGTEYKTGLAANATWVAGSDPATTDQGINWQAGAHITEVISVNKSCCSQKIYNKLIIVAE